MSCWSGPTEASSPPVSTSRTESVVETMPATRGAWRVFDSRAIAAMGRVEGFIIDALHQVIIVLGRRHLDRQVTAFARLRRQFLFRHSWPFLGLLIPLRLRILICGFWPHARLPTVMLDSQSCYNTRLFPQPSIDLPVAEDLGDAKKSGEATAAYELGSLGLCRGPGMDRASVTAKARSSSDRASAWRPR